MAERAGVVVGVSLEGSVAENAEEAGVGDEGAREADMVAPGAMVGVEEGVDSVAEVVLSKVASVEAWGLVAAAGDMRPRKWEGRTRHIPLSPERVLCRPR